MMDIVLEIASILLNMFSMLNIWMIMSLLFGCDMRVTPRNLGIASGVFIFVNVLSLLIFDGNDIIITVIIFAYNVLVTLILTNKSRIKALFLEIPALLVYVQFCQFFNLIEKLVGGDKYLIGEEGLTPADFIGDIILFIILIMLSRTKVAKGKSIQLTVGEGVLLTLFCFFSPLIVRGLEWFEGMAHDSIYKLAWIWFMIILNVAVIYAIAHRKMTTYYRQLSENYKKEFEAEYSFFQKYKKQQEDTVRFRHDWKNHMLLLQEMLEREEYGKAEQYFKTLTADTSKSVYKIATGNELLDMILSTKMAALEENEITLQCKGALSEFQFMSYVDGCVLFSNLIDNAIEGNAKVEGMHYISLTAKKTESLFYLEIRNPMEGKLKYQKGQVQSTKTGKEQHGIGLRQVYDIIEKYNGEYHITTKNQEYIIQMVFTRYYSKV